MRRRLHVFKTEQYISNITDEKTFTKEQYISNLQNTFTKQNSISVILLMRISNITVYKTEQYISNITDENTFTKLNSIY